MYIHICTIYKYICELYITAPRLLKKAHMGVLRTHVSFLEAQGQEDLSPMMLGSRDLRRDPCSLWGVLQGLRRYITGGI